jgi:hypothetical protein
MQSHPRTCRTCRRVRKRAKKDYKSAPVRKGSVLYRRMQKSEKAHWDWLMIAQGIIQDEQP